MTLPTLNASRPLRTALGTLKRDLIWVAIFGCLTNLLMLTPTLYMLQVFDRVMLSANLDTLFALSAMALVLFAAMGFADWLRSRLLVRMGLRFDALMQEDVFRATFAASMSGGKRVPAQPLNDLAQIRQFLTGNGIFAAVDLPWTFVYIGVLFLMHPWLGYTALAFAALMVALAVFSHRVTAPQHEAVQATQVESTGYLLGKLRNAETVEAMGMLGSLRRRWFSIHDRASEAGAQAQELSHRMQAAVKFVQYSQQSLILALGALLAIDGKISAGAMIACNALMGNALRPIGLVVQTWKQFIDTRLAFRRLETLLHEHPPVHVPLPSTGHTMRLFRPITGQITLRAFKATAPQRKAPILAGLDIEFQAGEVVAIVGPSGAGKSTLARCLIGIWPYTEGELLLDGQAMREWDRDALGPQLGYLPQDIELFDGTIAQNIARFSQVPSDQIIAAAQQTGIHDMVLRMPKGYDTPMGEAGGLLSGGQRQRIALARAVLGQPRLVVLDEPNANLDDAGEAALLHTVRELRSSGTTVFMIVHQQNMLVAADRILFLENGLIKRFAKVQLQAAPNRIEAPTP